MPGEPGDGPETPDAGGDSDKEEIQQLAGKLSQKLQDYNDKNGNGNGDSDLNKYVMNMIATQASRGLDDSDKSDVVKKIEDGGDEDGGDTPDGGPEEADAGGSDTPEQPAGPEGTDSPAGPGNAPEPPKPANESKGRKPVTVRITEAQFKSMLSFDGGLDEVVDSIMNGDDKKTDGTDLTLDKPVGFLERPFTAPRFRK